MQRETRQRLAAVLREAGEAPAPGETLTMHFGPDELAGLVAEVRITRPLKTVSREEHFKIIATISDAQRRRSGARLTPEPNQRAAGA